MRQVASLLGDSNLTGDRSIFHAADKVGWVVLGGKGSNKRI